MKKIILTFMMFLIVSLPVYAKGVVQLIGQVNIVYDTMYGPDGLPVVSYINHDFAITVGEHDEHQYISIWATDGVRSISCTMDDSYPGFIEYLRRIQAFGPGRAIIMNQPKNGVCSGWALI